VFLKVDAEVCFPQGNWFWPVRILKSYASVIGKRHITYCRAGKLAYWALAQECVNNAYWGLRYVIDVKQGSRGSFKPWQDYQGRPAEQFRTFDEFV
jgi:hypothetical protein